MATLAVNKIERQIANLSPEDQLYLLEHLVEHLRVGVADNRGFRAGDLAAAVAAEPRIQSELDRLASEYKSAESDLLNDVW
jgi:hypothetical protein